MKDVIGAAYCVVLLLSIGYMMELNGYLAVALASSPFGLYVMDNM